VLHAARLLKPKRVLLLAYNSRLRHDCRAKQEAVGLSNLEVHTYHSMGYKFYTRVSKDDTGLRSVVEGDMEPTVRVAFDVVVVDEAQDMTPLFCEFLHKLLGDNTVAVEPQLLVIGDNRQCIYDFQNADERHLTLAHRGVFHSQRVWKQLHLATSYRLTGNMATFINEVVLGHKRIKARKPPGEPVVYLRGSPFTMAIRLAEQLSDRIKSGDLDPSSIYVVASSMKQGTGRNPTPINKLENCLVEKGVPCFAVSSDEESIDAATIEGKVVFSTIHQSKGLEREVVVCFGMDRSWYRFYGKDLDQSECPNIWYVALTRATRQLFIIAEKQVEQHIPFVRVDRLEELAQGQPGGNGRSPVVKVGEASPYDGGGPKAVDKGNLDTKFSSATVTELTRHLVDSDIQKAYTSLNPKQLAGPSHSVSIPDKIKGVNGLVEPVADINGVALTAMFEQMTSGGNTSIMQQLQTDWASTNATLELQDEAQRLIERPLKAREDPATFLQLASIYQTLGSGFAARPFQVDNWNYVPKKSVDACMAMIETHLGGRDVKYEMELTATFSAGIRTEVRGRVDALTDSTLWELKCVGSLSKEHFLQTALYAWLWMKAPQGREALGSRFFRLLNFRTGELWAIDDEFGIDTSVAEVILAKYRDRPPVDDGRFLDNCRSFHWRSRSARRARNDAPTLECPPAAPAGGRPLPFKCFTCKPTRSFRTEQALMKHSRKAHGE